MPCRSKSWLIKLCRSKSSKIENSDINVPLNWPFSASSISWLCFAARNGRGSRESSPTWDRFDKTLVRAKEKIDESSSSNFGQKSNQQQHVQVFWTIILDFKVSSTYKVIITNLNLTQLGFICKFRPKRFHKIDFRRLYSSSSKSGWSSATTKPAASAVGSYGSTSSCRMISEIASLSRCQSGILSYFFWISSYNASIVVGYSVFTLEKNIFYY
jgi:hypothetical protein